MTERKTVTFNERIYEGIKKTQAEFIASGEEHDDMSFTTAVNMLVLGGLIFAPDDPEHEDWELVRDFLNKEAFDLNQAHAVDREAEKRFLEGARSDPDEGDN